MPIKWKKIWHVKRKWTKNIKTDPKDIKSVNLGNWNKTLNENALKVARMNQAKVEKWITWGRKRKYTPENLLKKINEYFVSNMLFEEILDKDMNIIDYKYIRMRAMSIYWLCNHLEISYWTFRDMSIDKKYTTICLQAKQKIMDAYIVWGLEWELDSRVSSIIINMQMQNERIEEWLSDWSSNLFQKIEVNIVTKDWEIKKKIDPVKIINVKPKG